LINPAKFNDQYAVWFSDNLKGCRAGGTYSPGACRGKLSRRRGHCKSTTIGLACPLMSALGQSRPNEAIDFESALTSALDMSLRRTK
jgi:hypothetical protein